MPKTRIIKDISSSEDEDENIQIWKARVKYLVT